VLSSQCCCQTSDNLCPDCFSGDANSLCCRLHNDDIVAFKIRRPGWGRSAFFPTGATACPCPEGTRVSTVTQFQQAQDILVYYKRFIAGTAEGDESGFWFYENGTNGRLGSVVSGNTSGDLSQSHLWNLWPPFCPNQIGDPATNTGATPACCNIDCTCSANTTPTYLGPQNSLPDSNFVCSNFVNTADNINVTKFQHQTILGNTPGTTYNNLLTCYTDPNTGPVQASFRTVCDFPGFGWLNGIYNDSANSIPSYKHYWWNPSSNSVQQGTGLFWLAQTLTGVYHKEKWFKACQKTPLTNSVPEANITDWPCRVPEYWLFGCAGVPIFSWEIQEMLDAGKITSAERDEFFKSQYFNFPLGKTAIGLSLIKKLQSTTWVPGKTGVGILETKDWRGYVKNDGTTVPNTEVRVVRKDLAKWSGNTKTVVHDNFYSARPGGWDHVCYAPPKGSCSDSWQPTEIRDECPQIPRGTGCNAANNTKCSYVDGTPQTGDAPSDPSGRCLSVGPNPQKGTCVDTTPSPNQGCCSPCTPGDCAANCGSSLLQQCGSGVVSCSKTVFNASCSSITFQHIEYVNQQRASPDGPSINQPPSDTCSFSGLGHLWVLNESCDSSDSSNPKTCQSHSCSPGPTDTFPNGPTHLYPPIGSKHFLCGQINGLLACTGSKTVAQIQSGKYCEGVRTLKSAVTDPNQLKPGQATIPPFNADGCGRHLCAEKDPLGACCVTENGTTTCRESVTQQQCEKCAEAAGVTSVWKGSNTCCISSNACS